MRRITAFVDMGKTVVRSAGAVLIFYFGFEALKMFAGRESTATFDFAGKIVAQISADRWVAYIFGLLGAGYGFGERKFRQRKTKRMASRIGELESFIDPKRSSSGLKKTGETREGD